VRSRSLGRWGAGDACGRLDMSFDSAGWREIRRRGVLGPQSVGGSERRTGPPIQPTTFGGTTLVPTAMSYAFDRPCPRTAGTKETPGTHRHQSLPARGRGGRGFKSDRPDSGSSGGLGADRTAASPSIRPRLFQSTMPSRGYGLCEAG
jgi:hypothetical protein